MKKSLICMLSILCTLGFPSLVQASVRGVCSNCHTMHSSQGGTPVAGSFFEGYTDANPSLLTATCVGCHSGEGTTITAEGVPIVYNIGGNFGADNTLAGGNFYYVKILNQNTGHNVAGITAADDTFATIPGSTTIYSQLTCAGESGCHGDKSTGNNELDAVSAAHHTDDSGGITGGSVGLSYRFLNGVTGIEDSDWEKDTAVHNVYKGSGDVGDSTTISSLCAQCHGNYHSADGIDRNSSPWLRHPTDIALPTDPDREYAAYDPVTAYSNIAPVAFINPDADPLVRSEAVVMCLSCHRAHGSPEFKMMRWDNTGGRLGCGVCHTSKK